MSRYTKPRGARAKKKSRISRGMENAMEFEESERGEEKLKN